jgi:hypothetical protein
VRYRNTVCRSDFPRGMLVSFGQFCVSGSACLLLGHFMGAAAEHFSWTFNTCLGSHSSSSSNPSHVWLTEPLPVSGKSGQLERNRGLSGRMAHPRRIPEFAFARPVSQALRTGLHVWLTAVATRWGLLTIVPGAIADLRELCKDYPAKPVLEDRRRHARTTGACGLRTVRKPALK